MRIEMLALGLVAAAVVASFLAPCLDRLNENLTKPKNAEDKKAEKAEALADSIVEREALRAEEQAGVDAQVKSAESRPSAPKAQRAPMAEDLEIPADFILSEFRQM